MVVVVELSLPLMGSACVDDDDFSSLLLSIYALHTRTLHTVAESGYIKAKQTSTSNLRKESSPTVAIKSVCW